MLKDFLKEVIYVEASDSISRALSKMVENGIHELPVLENGNFLGMIYLKRILKETFSPLKTKLKNFVESVPFIKKDFEIEDCIKILCSSGVRALPIIEDSKLIGIVSENDLIRYVSKKLNLGLEKIGRNVIVAGEDSSIAKVFSIMKRKYISRVPLINWEEKVVGIVDNLEIAKLLRFPKEKLTYSKISLEKLNLREFKAKDYCREACILEAEKYSFKKVLELLSNNSEVVLSKEGRAFKIITPKNILNFSYKKYYNINIRFNSYLEPFEIYEMRKDLEKFYYKIEKIINIEGIFADLREYKSDGRKKFSIHLKILSPTKTFSSKSFGWNFIKTLHSVLKIAERMVVEFKEKKKDRERGKPKAYSLKF